MLIIHTHAVAVTSVRTKTLRRFGLTLVELLVVVAIIGVLIGLLLTSIQKVRDSARKIQCANNMHQVGLAFHVWHEARGVMPRTEHWNPITQTVRYQPGRNWACLLAPWIESLESEPRQEHFQLSDDNVTFSVNTYHCPARSGSPIRIDYAAHASPRRNWDDEYAPTRSAIFAETFSAITDGLSNTILLAEKESFAVIPAPAIAREIVEIVDFSGLTGNKGYFIGGLRQLVGDTCRRDGREFVPSAVSGYKWLWRGDNFHYQASGGNGTPFITMLYEPAPGKELGYGAPHSGGMNVLYCDGSVRPFAYGHTGLLALFIRDDGLPASVD